MKTQQEEVWNEWEVEQMNERMEMVQHADTERTGKEPRSPVGASLKPGSGTTAKVEQRREPAKHVPSVSYPPPRANWRLRSHSCQKKKKKRKEKNSRLFILHTHTLTHARYGGSSPAASGKIT